MIGGSRICPLSYHRSTHMPHPYRKQERLTTFQVYDNLGGFQNNVSVTQHTYFIYHVAAAHYPRFMGAKLIYVGE